MEPARKRTAILGLAFALIWSAPLSFFDVWWGHEIARQLGTIHYRIVDGKVLSCRETTIQDAEGWEGGDVAVEYSYHVRNQNYTGSRIRYLKLWGPAWVSQFVAQHPSGTANTVYYDPNDPARALLFPGMGGQELFIMLFLLPFHVIGLLLWSGFLISAFATDAAYVWLHYGIRLTDGDYQRRVRLPRVCPSAAGLHSLFLGSIILCFLVFCCAGAPLPLWVSLAAWLVVLLGSGLFYAIQAVQLASGRAHLVINSVEKTVSLPQTFDRKGPIRLALSDLVAVQVVPVKTNRNNTERYAPILRCRWAGNGFKDEKLAELNEKEQAEQFAMWIRERTGLDSAGTGQAPSSSSRSEEPAAASDLPAGAGRLVE
jgi:Protein of unknown function (DUF3592)